MTWGTIGVLPKRDGATIVVGAATMAVAALLVSRAPYVPIWDGWIYAECIIAAATPPFSLGALRCASHPSQVYVAYMALVQSLAPTSYVPMLLANAVILVVASFGFARLTKLVFPSPHYRLDRGLLVAAFMVQPAVLAGVVQPGLDLPLLPAFLWCIVFLIERRRFAACLAGLAMAFTKETGVLLYGVLVASYAVARVAAEEADLGSRARALVRLAPLLLPIVVFAGYLAYRAYSPAPSESVLWSAGGSSKALLRQFIVPRVDRHLINYLAIAFVLNFAWMPSVCIATDALAGAMRLVQRRSRRELAGATLALVDLVAIVTLVTAFALTRFATFGNTRYLLPLIALLLLPFFAALVRLGVTVVARRVTLGVFGMALLASDVRTADPVSRLAYGTFPVGGRRMLRMTSITHECCGAGRDQLVYSLQFTVLAHLTSDAMVARAVDESTLVVIPDSTAWDALGRLDSVTHERTLRVRNAFRAQELEYDSLLALPVPFKRAVFVGFPYANVDVALQALRTRYDVVDGRRVRRGRYWLDTYEVRARDTRP